MQKFYVAIIVAVVFSYKVSAQPFSLVKDIYPGTTGGAAGVSSYLTEMNGKVYFLGIHPDSGNELWVSDGTEAGTYLVKDINPGTASSSPAELIKANGILFFIANDGVHGNELWKSDGTETGTVMVKDINAGSDNALIGQRVNVNGTLFFWAYQPDTGNELWKSDGTEEGTVMVKEFYPGTADGKPSGMPTSTFQHAATIYNINGTAFFSAIDNIHGKELWKSDGTLGGTVLVKEFVAGTGSSDVRWGVNNNGIFYFCANDGTHGYELWKSDGTEAGTVMIKDIYAGAANGYPFGLTSINGVVVFFAVETVHGLEPWVTDGTEAGTFILKDIDPGPQGSVETRYSSTSNKLFFAAEDGTSGVEQWVTDGTVAGTHITKDIFPGSESSHTMPSTISCTSNMAFFSVRGDLTTGMELWKSDGTEAGTFFVQEFFEGITSGNPVPVVIANGKYFLTAISATHGRELWVSTISPPLPLTLSDFKAQLLDNDGMLNWKTSFEENTFDFEIERSLNGKNFTKVGSIAASGNSSVDKNYNYSDRNITSLNVPVIYYRLKMRDIDNKFTYSKIIAININNSGAVVMLYPSPVRESATLMVSVTKKRNITYTIADASGKTVLNKHVTVNPGSNTITVETAILSSGVYILSVNGDNISNRLKFVKQ